jgi:hypothetical protein
MTIDALFTEDTMCDCLELDTVPPPDTVEYAEPTRLAIDQLPDSSEYGLPVPLYDDIIELARSNPQPDVPVAMSDVNVPSLASIDNQMDASMLNIIDAYPGFEARVDPSTDSVAYFAPGDLTPSF